MDIETTGPTEIIKETISTSKDGILEPLTQQGAKSAKRGKRGFCHFWHPLTLGILKVRLVRMGAQRRVFQRKGDLG
jgi:hypothetical protein